MTTPSGPSEFESDSDALGLPDDESAAAVEQVEDELFGVWPENDKALHAFLVCRRQWRVGPMGGVLGLDYAGIESLLRMNRIEISPELLADLDVMEGAAMDVLNAPAQRNGG